MAKAKKKAPKKKSTRTNKPRTVSSGKRAGRGGGASRETSRGSGPARVAAILSKLDEAYPAVTCALNHDNPFQLLISTILSAQCTDERVNIVTATLFPKYPSPEAFAYATPSVLEQDIRPTGFFRN